jgi:Sec-independent protein translocase protein TatA
MFSLSPVKIFVIVAVVVLLLGPDKLPEVAHKLGTTWQSLRRFQQRVETEVRDALPDLPSTGDIARMARSPIHVLNKLADRAENSESQEDSTYQPAPSPTSSLITPLVNPPVAPPPAPTGNISADPSLN